MNNNMVSKILVGMSTSFSTNNMHALQNSKSLAIIGALNVSTSALIPKKKKT